jgi:hypothetical protein
VCLRCGRSLRVQLTRALMEETVELIKRDGYHSVQCVETPEGWCCVPDCPTERSRRGDLGGSVFD